MNKAALVKSRAVNLFIYLLLFAACLPVIWVLCFMLGGALMPPDEIGAITKAVFETGEGTTVWPLLPSWPTLAPLTQLLLDTPQFFKMFWNSFAIVLPSLIGQLFIACPTAWALSRFEFKSRKLIFSIYICLMLMPFQVTMVANYLVMNKLELLNSRWALILPFAFSAFPVFIMAKGFDGVPKALMEAASIDGAGYVRTFIRIGLPLGVPGILSALVLGFLETWNAIEQPMTFLEDPSLWPLSLYLPQIAKEKLSLAMSASLLMLLPAVLIFLFGQKYLELGIQSSGIK